MIETSKDRHVRGGGTREVRIAGSANIRRTLGESLTSGRTRRTGFLAALLLIALATGMSGQDAVPEPTESWLFHYGLEPWEVVLDHDGDGSNAAVEFAFGTDPFDPLSRPPRFEHDPEAGVFVIESPVGVSFGNAVLESSVDLREWIAVPGFPSPAEAALVLEPGPDGTAKFYRFSAIGLSDADGDCLLDFEEVHLFGTDPLKADSDGDGLTDCEEILVHRTDPNRGSTTGRGSIEGRVVLDEDLDPSTEDHPGLDGWTVFVDVDFDAERDSDEPSAVTDGDGDYIISELDPGFYRVCLERRPVWMQIFPALAPLPTPDGFPDRAVEVFDSGTGPLPFPYGRYVDPLPGLRLVFPSPPPDPVDVSVLLGPLPPGPIAGPFGGWSHVDILAIPTDSFVTVAFDGEEIFDGPGPDLAIWCAAATIDDSAELSLGATPEKLVVAGVFTQEETILVDLADVSVPEPVRYLKLRGLGLVGTYPGIDVVGFQALNYRPLSRGHHEVTVAGGQTVDGVNFGVAGDDRPPTIVITTGSREIRAGESLDVGLIVGDDLGVTATRFAANGVPVALDAELVGSVPVANGGLLTLTASATDTAGQESTTTSSLIARNADGTLPDLSGLSNASGAAAGGPSIQVHSPVAGEILDAPRAIVATITGTTHPVSDWQIHYAPIDAVNPEALDAADPDYILVGEGTGPMIQAELGTLDGAALPSGGYFMRVSASDTQGSTRYLGFVVGVRVDPLDLRPEIAIFEPASDAMVTFLTDVRGSISTRATLREWSVEYAPLSQVNLDNLADAAPDWTLLAEGSEPVANGVLATFDPTLLPNDSYVIRVSAWNTNGLGWCEPLVVQVSGNAKLGNFAVEFTDVEIPLAGIPITVKRVYDSLNVARSGDFGFGWSLALQDADVAETIPQTGAGFASTPFRVGTRVYLTAPDGNRIGFTFEPEIGASSLLGAAYKAVFTPDPGIRYTLEVPEGDSAFLSLTPEGELVFFFIPLPWNPDTYILTDPDGLRYTYDQHDGLLEIEDMAGNRVTFADSAITHSAGPMVALERDPAGRITEITAPDGCTWRYEYDAAGDLIEVVYPGAITATFAYTVDPPHFLETINDPKHGPTQRTEYDEEGRVVAVIDADGNRREQTWDPGSFTGTLTDANGHVTLLTYDARGNITRREDPLGGVTTWEYGNAAFPDFETAVTDPRGHRTTWQYDERGNRTRVSDSIRQTTYVFDDANRVTRITHGGLGSEDFEYDSRGFRTLGKSQRGTIEFERAANGLLAGWTDGEDGVTRIEYDDALGTGMPTAIVLPDGSTNAFAYDPVGRLVMHADPLGEETVYEYDEAGRLVRVVDPAGAETLIVYDGAFPQQIATLTDRAGRVREYEYDTLGRIVRLTEPGGAVTRFEYDPAGNTTAVVDPLGNRWEYRYDALGQLIEETDPLGMARTYTRDPAGNVIDAVDRNGRRRTFVYDARNRLTQEEWIDPQDNSVVRTITYTYDRIDQLSRVGDADAEIRHVRMYVPDGPILAEEARYAGAPVRRIAFSYDKAGRRSNVGLTTTSPTLEPALAFDYTRDLAGRLSILTSRNPLPPSTTSDLACQVQLWRNPRGDVTELRRFSDISGANEVSRTIIDRADSCCAVDRIEHFAAGNQPLPDATLTLTRLPDTSIAGIQEGATEFSYTYDDAGQLTRTEKDGLTEESYAYDANGNRTGSHRHATYVTSPANRVAQAGPWTLTYDHEGNLVTKSNGETGASQIFHWDHRNRLVRIDAEDGMAPGVVDTTEYRYDPFDRRIAVIRDGGTRWTYHDEMQPLADFLDDESTPFEVYLTSDERLDELHAVWQRGQGIAWTLSDHLGTPRRLLDSAGNEIAALGHDSFGNPLAATGSRPDATGRFGFTGREWDPSTGLYFHRARYYDPDIGRFISEDPSGFSAGDANVYRYVANDPLHHLDPTGLVSAIEYRVLSFLVVPTAGCLGGAAFELYCDTQNRSVTTPQDLAGSCAIGFVGGVLANVLGAATAWTIPGLVFAPVLKPAFIDLSEGTSLQPDFAPLKSCITNTLVDLGLGRPAASIDQRF